MEFIPTYLYIKKHNVTGLMYFGKTINSDVVKYKGSGVRWNRHLEKHGNDVSTIFCELFEDESDLKEFAEFFSEVHDIKNSKLWANLMEENGSTGGDCRTGLKHTPETKAILSEKAKNRPKEWRENHSVKMTGRKYSKEKVENMKIVHGGEGNGMYGKKHTQESKDKMAAAKRGKKASLEAKSNISKAKIKRDALNKKLKENQN